MVPFILLLTEVAFLSISVLMVVVGVLAIGGHIAGGVGGGIAAVVVGLLPLYLAYLFARSAWRIRMSVPGAVARARQRSTLKAAVGYAAFVIASNVLAPVPTGAKVAGTVLAVMLVPLLLAAELEPRR